MSSKLPWSISLSVSEPRSSTESIDLVFSGAIVDKPLVRRRLSKKRNYYYSVQFPLIPRSQIKIKIRKGLLKSV